MVHMTVAAHPITEVPTGKILKAKFDMFKASTNVFVRVETFNTSDDQRDHYIPTKKLSKIFK